MKLLHTTFQGKPHTRDVQTILSVTPRLKGGAWLDLMDGTTIVVEEEYESIRAKLLDDPAVVPTPVPLIRDAELRNLISRLYLAVPLHHSDCAGNKCRESTCDACCGAESVRETIRTNGALIDEARAVLKGEL